MASRSQLATRVSGLDETAMAAARQRQNQLTKPPGSLGRLEELSIQLAGITGQPQPTVERKAIVVMAGDHGVTVEGVSAYPAEVTPQMVLNFLRGGAAINVIARQVGARVVVVDMGVAAEIEPHPELIDRKIAAGTANMARGPAMSVEQAETALAVGMGIAADLAVEGLQLIGTGEMGIGNTTPSSAITAALTGAPVAEVVGRGTGVDDAGLARKIEIVERALAVNRPSAADPIDVLAKVGGFEIAGLAGLILGSAGGWAMETIDSSQTGHESDSLDNRPFREFFFRWSQIIVLLAVSICAVIFALLKAAFHKQFFAVLKNIQGMIVSFILFVTIPQASCPLC